jgi:hypothetical protein
VFITRRLGVRLAGLAAAGLLLAACTEGEPGDRPSIGESIATATERPTSTRSLDRTTEPTRGDESAEPTRDDETTEPTRDDETTEPTRDDETTEPTTERTVERTVTETIEKSEDTEEPPQAAEPTVAAPSETAVAGETGTEDTESVPAWVWWLLLAAGVAAGAGVWLLQGRSRRQEWERNFASATDEAAWFASRLIPDLAHVPTPQQRALAWGAASERVGALEDRLAGLGATTSDLEATARAQDLANAVRLAHGRVDQLILAADPAALGDQLWAVGRDLDAAVQLARPPVDSPAPMP